MKKSFVAFVITLIMVICTCLSAFPSYAAVKKYTYSPKYSYRWYQSEDDVWHIEKDGELIKNARILDKEGDVSEGLWYLIDENGDMVSDPLVVDDQGRYYSFQQEHDGHFGTMRTQDGHYDGVFLSFSKSKMCSA